MSNFSFSVYHNLIYDVLFINNNIKIQDIHWIHLNEY